MTALAGVDVAILAGGLGTRLRSVVDDRPKVLAEVGGRPFLAYLLDLVASSGARRVVLCTGYLADQVPAAFGAEYRGLELVYSPEPRPLGTAGALRWALPALTTEHVAVLNGDSYVEAPFGAMLAQHLASGADATLLLAPVDDTGRYGGVEVDGASRVLRFAEKGSDGPGWASAGVYLLRRTLLEAVPADRAMSIERDLFPAWIGPKMYAYLGDAPFLDIGVPDAFQRAPDWLLRPEGR